MGKFPLNRVSSRGRLYTAPSRLNKRLHAGAILLTPSAFCVFSDTEDGAQRPAAKRVKSLELELLPVTQLECTFSQNRFRRKNHPKRMFNKSNCAMIQNAAQTAEIHQFLSHVATSGYVEAKAVSLGDSCQAPQLERAAYARRRRVLPLGVQPNASSPPL